MTRLVALYKTYDGEEWLEASLTSVYESVDKIYIFDSQVSWLGDYNNTVQPAIRYFMENVDDLNKVVLVPYDSSSQDDQYRYAVNYLNRQADFDYILIVDSDEIWDAEQLEAAKQYIESDVGPAYQVAMRTYIKSPYYLIDPPEPCHPCTFVRRGIEMAGVRGNTTPGMRQLPGVFFHHFTAVRADEAAIRRKIHQSNHADRQKSVSVDLWMETRWHQLPDVLNFHYTIGYENAWQGVRVIGFDELPRTLRLQDHPLVSVWQHTRKVDIHNLPFGELVHADEEMLRKHARGKRNVVDLGTFLGRSACIMASYAKNVTTVDVFEDIDLIQDEKSRKHYRILYDRSPHPYETVASSLAGWNNIRVVRGRTHAALEHDVDLLFIDDDHSREGVARAFAAYLPRLVDGAMVLFHDSINIKNGACEFVDEVMSQRPEFEHIDSGGSITAWRYTKET